MPLWQWVADSAGVVLLLALLYGVLLVVRRRILSRRGGTFELSVRVSHRRPGQGWGLGLGRYQGDRLEWFRIFTPSIRPKASWHRDHLSYSGRREANEAERHSLFAGQVVVVCETVDGPVEMAMSEAALTGLQSWLEAGPPGQRAGAGG